MATTDPSPAEGPGQARPDPLSELRRAAAAIDAAWTSKQSAKGQSDRGEAPTDAEELARLLQVHHLRKMAALCSMAARLLLERASSCGPDDHGPPRTSDSDVQAVRQFLEAQLAAADKARAPGSAAAFCPASVPPANAEARCSCDCRTDGMA